MTNTTRTMQFIAAVEKEFSAEGYVCFLEQWTDPEFEGASSILRVLNVPEGQLVSVEDRAYSAAERLLLPGEALPFAISSHLPRDSEPGGAFFATLVSKAIEKASYVDLSQLVYHAWPVFVECFDEARSEQPGPRPSPLNSLAA
jgi:hypothetical protein